MTNYILRYVELSKATSESEKKEDARKTIRYIFTHIMEGVWDFYNVIFPFSYIYIYIYIYC